MTIMSTVCSHCGGTDIEYDGARGDAVCTNCGSVLEDNIIVSEVTFQEQSSGASSLVGQFVSAEGGSGSKAPLSGSGFHHGLNRDSREITLQQAKRRLTHLGNLLKLNQHCIDTAFGFFKMALQLNLTRGRKSSIMDTACLYLVCRSEGTPHMLLDFSDVLQINVYSLGRAYLKLSTALHINPPAIDPCLYIHRFAHKLELGDKVHDVSMTALRLVARMKRDWIHHGRRPAGLCGASLLVSARLHNFNRSVREVARVVKLSEGTIRKRLGDFKDTPSSRLTIDEFLKIDLEQEHDPPCFLEAKKRVKQLYQTSSEMSGTSLQSQDDSLSQLLSEENQSTEVHLTEGDDEDASGYSGIKLKSVQDIIAKARMAEAFYNVPTAGLSDSLSDLAQLVEEKEIGDIEPGNTQDPDKEDGKKLKDIVKENTGDGELELDGINDEEIDQMLLSEDEVKIKSQLWFAENGDFLKELEAKKEKLAALEAEKANRTKKKPVRRRRREPQYQTPASTAGEAIERMLVEKRISAKINYDVLRDLDKQSLDMNLDEQVNTSVSNLDIDKQVLETGLPVKVEQPQESTLSISRITKGSNRVPSLATRKRTLVSRAAISNESKYRCTDTVEPISRKLPTTSTTSTKSSSPVISQVDTSTDKDSTIVQDKRVEFDDERVEFDVVEETGPVEYVEEDEEGIGDDDMENLAYEGDPLLNSDYEDDCEDYL